MTRVPGAKYENIDLLRAFAAIAVLVYHVIEHGHWTAFPGDGPASTFRIGWIGVEIFFVVSGFVIAYSSLLLYRAGPELFARRYWRRRLARILPLYFVTLVAWVVFVRPGYFSQPAGDWAWDLFTHVAFIHSFWPETHGSIDGPNWSLAIEMQFYLAVALLIRWIDATPGWRIWLYGILVAWAWRACMELVYGGTMPVPFVQVAQLPGCLDEFGAGIFLAKWVLERPRRTSAKGAAWFAAAVATGYVTFAIYWSHARYWDNPWMVVFWRTSLSVFLLCVVATAVELPQSLARRWLRAAAFLGEISYGIYLWHLFAVFFMLYVVGASPPVALAGALALTIVISTISWFAFEKPFMRLGRAQPGADGIREAQSATPW